jgi:RNA polymerase sigma-70 factor, ECF subfamily
MRDMPARRVPAHTMPHPELQSADEARVPELAELYRDHSRTVAGWAVRLLGPGEDIEDLVQEVFMVVQRRLPEFRGDAKVTTWLYEITLRLVHRARRRKRLRRWLQVDRGGRALQVPAEAPGPQQALESREATATVYAVLDRLAERDRTLLIMFEIEGLPGQEIAQLLGTTAAVIWVRLHRARARFLENLRIFEQERRPKR